MIKIIDSNNSFLKCDKELFGGKSCSLIKLTNNKFLVPKFFVLSSEFFDKFMGKRLKNNIYNLINNIDRKNLISTNNSINIIKNLIRDKNIPNFLSKKIISKYREMSMTKVAVRSSANVEDSISLSFAGSFDSYLNVDEVNLIEKIKECWASMYNVRNLYYVNKNGLDLINIKIAVIIQEMVYGEFSGVCFTVNPVNNQSEMVIEACPGNGENTVGGCIIPETHIINKKDYSLIKINNNLGLLNNINDLIDTCKKIESCYNYPQDIEWAFANDNFYILQSRPITTLKND